MKSGRPFPGARASRPLPELRRDLERRYVTTVFREAEGDIQKVTAKLGVKRSRFYTWVQELELDVKELREGL